MMRSHQLSRRLAAASGVLALVTATAALADSPPLQSGRAVYDKWCAACHDPGITHPGTHALMTKYNGVKSGVLLEWTDLSVTFVKIVVRHGISVMPQFRKTEIGDAELEALAAYLARNSK
jgi:mono/diheme cytochrome c family protein